MGAPRGGIDDEGCHEALVTGDGVTDKAIVIMLKSVTEELHSIVLPPTKD